MKIILFSLLLSLAASAVQQTIFLDYAGQKGGDIEKLYSEEGLKEIYQQVNDTLKEKDDSVYFIIETKDFSQAILASVYVRDNGRWVGSIQSRGRDENAAVDCQYEKMATMNIDYRADQCYYNEKDYFLIIGRAGAIEYTSAEEFIQDVKEWAHAYTPLTTRTKLIDSDPAMKAKFDENTMVIKTTKLFPFLNNLTVLQFGYSVNLSEPTGWVKGPVVLNEHQAKVAAVIDRLSADKKIYMSYNVRCPAEAQPFIVTNEKAHGVIIPRNEFTEKCGGMMLMGETLEQIYETMSAYGYKYDETLKVWN